MSEPTIRIGIAGCGQRLTTIAKHLLQETSLAGQLEISALFDPSASAMESLRDKVAPRAEMYPDFGTFLAKSGVDWVMIGSWNCAHADQIVAALAAGKHVFAEKPLATSLEDCLRIKAALESARDRQFFFGLVLRYAPIYRKIKELLEAGVVGRPISFEFNETLDFNHGGYIHGNWRRRRELAGTHLLEKCCHDFDIANWLMDSLPVSAASFGGRNVFTPENSVLASQVAPGPNGEIPYQAWADPERVDPFSEGASIVDNQVAILEYASGVRATFHTNCHAAIRERRMYILGTKGALRADAVAGHIETQRIGFETTSELFSPRQEGGHFGADQEMAEHLARTMVHHQAPLATLEDGLRATVSCLGVDRALDDRQVVDLQPLWKQAGISLARNA